MKKILASLLIATMLFAMFVMPAAADDFVNVEVEVEDTDKAPKIDGEVKKNEYSALPLRSYSTHTSEFTPTDASDDHDEYDNWDFDFYMTWDEDNLYMAWVVKSEIHHGLEEGTYSSDGTKTADTWPADGYETMLGHIWWNSCVQFIITPGAPKNGESNYANNYLEAGIALLGDGTQARMIWKTPTGFATEDINVNEWNAAIVRDDSAKTTTYEVAIPWKYTTVNAKGDNAQFGLSFAVAAQENYNTKKGMIEWQDCVLGNGGVKAPDKAAIITLKSETIEETIIDSDKLQPGEYTQEMKDAEIRLTFDNINDVMGAEGGIIITDLEGKDLGSDYGLNYSYAMLLKPVEGDEYEVIETALGNGSIALSTAIEDGMIVAAFHSDGTEGATGRVRRENAMKVGVGSKVGLFGVDVEEDKLSYSNPEIWVKELVADPNNTDSSETESSDPTSTEPSDVESSEEASSEAVSEEDSSVAATSSEAPVDEEDGGLGVWLWVIIAVVVVAVVVVVIIVLKKKKA